MRYFWETYKELLGDVLLMVCGAILVYIFVTIEIVGWYGQEANNAIRRIEVGVGALLILLGIERFIHDLKARAK